MTLLSRVDSLPPPKKRKEEGEEEEEEKRKKEKEKERKKVCEHFRCLETSGNVML